MDPITTEGLEKVYGRGRGVRALAGCDLSVPEGSIFALLGRNGAGKTTLVKILLDLVRPTRGQASLLGRPVGDHRVRRKVGFLPEGQAYPGYMSARQYVRWMGVLSGLPRKDADRRACERLELTGMADAMHRRISGFSKGMCQRTGLAAALVHDPQVVFLDEPTDGVDPMGRREIREIILGLRQAGSTIFLNSHLLAEVDQICDHLAIVNRGRILVQGTREEVKRAALGAEDAPGVIYRVRSQGEDLAPAREGLPGVLDETTEDGSEWTVRLDSEAEATTLIDHLRSRGLGIAALEPLGASLEDRFIALVTEDDTRMGGGAP